MNTNEEQRDASVYTAAIINIKENELNSKQHAAKDEVDVCLQDLLRKVNEDMNILEISDDVYENKCFNEHFCTLEPNFDDKQVSKPNIPEFSLNSDSMDNAVSSLSDATPAVRSVRAVRRTMSECCTSVQKGILKYPRDWRRRTLSESNCDATLSCEEVDGVNFSGTESVNELSGFDGDFHDGKPKKNVRFNDHISKTTFRSNSSILGRKRKNQKRSERRKGQVKVTISESLSTEDIPSSTSNEVTQELNNVAGDTEIRHRQDSGYDSEECSKCDNCEGKWFEVVSKKTRRRRNRNCKYQFSQVEP